jgi:glutamate-1-semialdehyde 2,1-aminomutase
MTPLFELNAIALAVLAAGAASLAITVPAARRRLQLSRAKHRSLAGHARMARRVARWLPGVHYDEARFFASDGAPDEVAARRRVGLMRLSAHYRAQYPRSLAASREAAEGLSDLQFTGAYRVPFQYARVLREHLRVPSFVQAASGVTLTDLDGNRFFDLTGSYGVNVFGVDVYKQCIAEGSARVQALGPVLGSLHPVVARNVERLKRISGPGRGVVPHVGHRGGDAGGAPRALPHAAAATWCASAAPITAGGSDVQPGHRQPRVMPRSDPHAVARWSSAALQVLRTRRDIACVLVNPLQALHPNSPAPGDSDAGRQARTAAHFNRAAYTAMAARRCARSAASGASC